MAACASPQPGGRCSRSGIAIVLRSGRLMIAMVRGRVGVACALARQRALAVPQVDHATSEEVTSGGASFVSVV